MFSIIISLAIVLRIICNCWHDHIKRKQIIIIQEKFSNLILNWIIKNSLTDKGINLLQNNFIARDVKVNRNLIEGMKFLCYVLPIIFALEIVFIHNKPLSKIINLIETDKLNNALQYILTTNSILVWTFFIYSGICINLLLCIYRNILKDKVIRQYIINTLANLQINITKDKVNFK